ncbi:hypothetical protein ABZV92_19120 [Streptomyces rubiginosohelvolus]
MNALVAKAAANNSTHLIPFAHRWQLLDHSHVPSHTADRHAAEAEAAP